MPYDCPDKHVVFKDLPGCDYGVMPSPQEQQPEHESVSVSVSISQSTGSDETVRIIVSACEGEITSTGESDTSHR